MISILSKLLTEASRLSESSDANIEIPDASDQEVIDINLKTSDNAWEMFFRLNETECFQDYVLHLKDNETVRINRLLVAALFKFVATKLQTPVGYNINPNECDMKDVSLSEFQGLIDILKGNVRQIQKKDIIRYIQITDQYGFVDSFTAALWSTLYNSEVVELRKIIQDIKDEQIKFLKEAKTTLKDFRTDTERPVFYVFGDNATTFEIGSYYGFGGDSKELVLCVSYYNIGAKHDSLDNQYVFISNNSDVRLVSKKQLYTVIDFSRIQPITAFPAKQDRRTLANLTKKEIFLELKGVFCYCTRNDLYPHGRTHANPEPVISLLLGFQDDSNAYIAWNKNLIVIDVHSLQVYDVQTKDQASIERASVILHASYHNTWIDFQRDPFSSRSNITIGSFAGCTMKKLFEVGADVYQAESKFPVLVTGFGEDDETVWVYVTESEYLIKYTDLYPITT